MRRHGTGTKAFHHPVVGDLTFTYEGLEVTEDPGLQLLIYTVQPGSDSAERLAVLGSWAASHSWRRRPHSTTPGGRKAMQTDNSTSGPGRQAVAPPTVLFGAEAFGHPDEK